MLLTSHIPSGPVPLHDALPPIISKLLLAALKIYRRLSFMTISTFLRARPTVCLSVSSLNSALAALRSLWDNQILHPDVNQHIEAHEQGLSAGLGILGESLAVQNPLLELLGSSQMLCCEAS